MVWETKGVIGGGRDLGAPSGQAGKPDATGKRPRARQMARLATTLMFHSTALATSLFGLPVLLPTYSRAYGQASCSPSPATITTNSEACSTTIVCTVPAGAVTQQRRSDDRRDRIRGVHREGRWYSCRLLWW